jgi:hypothetical protein
VKARQLARLTRALPGPRELPSNWKRIGFSDSDFENGGGDHSSTRRRLGDVGAAEARAAHLDAGASHVCIQPINPSGQPVPDWRVLEALAPGRAG